MRAGLPGETIAKEFVVAFFSTEIRSWRGDEPLWKVFWISGVARSAIIAALYAGAIFTGHIALQQVLLLCFAMYTAWILVSVWRCARNVRERLWGLLARLLTVAWACNATMVLAFLQLDLVSKYLGH